MNDILSVSEVLSIGVVEGDLLIDNSIVFLNAGQDVTQDYVMGTYLFGNEETIFDGVLDIATMFLFGA